MSFLRLNDESEKLPLSWKHVSCPSVDYAQVNLKFKEIT